MQVYVLLVPPPPQGAKDLPITHAPGLERATLPSVEGVVSSLERVSAR